MIEKALSESALLFGNTNKVFASFERTPNLFVPEKMSSSFPISPQNCSILLFKELFGLVTNKDIDYDILCNHLMFYYVYMPLRGPFNLDQ